MLHRVEVGLADEGVRVLRAVPASCVGRAAAGGTAGGAGGAWADPISEGLYATTVVYTDRGLPFTAGLRAWALVEAFNVAAPPEAGAPLADVVLVCATGPHAPAVWRFGRRVARSAGARLVLEVSGPAGVRHAGALRDLAAAGSPVRFIAPDPGLVAEVARVAPGARAALVPWGVHPAQPRPPDERGGRTPTLAVVGAGCDPRAAAAALGHAAGLLPGLMAMVDAPHAGAGRGADLWALAEGNPALAGRVTLVAQLEARRDLALDCDGLLLLDGSGAHRSIALEAMARGVVVFARPHVLNETLVDNVSCVFMPDPGASPGAALAAGQCIAGVLADGPRAAGLRASARDFVARQRTVSAQVRALLATCSTP